LFSEYIDSIELSVLKFTFSLFKPLSPSELYPSTEDPRKELIFFYIDVKTFFTDLADKRGSFCDEFSNFKSVSSTSPVEFTETPSAFLNKTLRELGGVLTSTGVKSIKLKLLFNALLSSSSMFSSACKILISCCN